jgi:hypothetical protein
VKTDLRKELIQLAAVAVAWLESMPFEKELVTDYVIIRILRRQLMFVDRVGGWTRNPTQAAHYSVLSEAKQARPHKVGTVALWKNIPRIVKSRGLIVMGPLTNREWGQR